ncbi:MAG: tetratricopeptide repeat protein [bacterium]|nr:tetratricopeptide repeat protein [bacterium]
MRVPTNYFFWLFTALSVLASLSPPSRAAAAALPDDPAAGVAAVGVPDENVPYGVAASWLLGHRLLAEGRTADALPLLHQAYRAQPEAAAIALDFQAALAAEGYVRDALTIMDKLVADHPDSASFRLRRSSLLARSGSEGDALAELRSLRADGADSPSLLVAEATLLVQGDKADRALDLLRGGIARFPEAAADLYLEMAGILQRGDRAADLADLMGEATMAAPERASLWMVRLRALAASGRWDEAAAVARDADRRFGDRGGSFGEPNDHPGAEDGLPADSFIVELADLHARGQRVDQAIALLLPLSESGELGLEPTLWLGRMLLGTGRKADGLALADRAVAAWPDAARARYLKGRVAELGEDWHEALLWYRRAAEAGPDDAEIRLACIRALLVAREKQPAVAAATALAERKRELGEHCTAAAALVPEQDTGGQMILAYGFRAAGDLMRAAERFAQAATDEQLRLGALIQKSLCHDDLGQEVEAREDLERLRREFPDNAEVANTLGYYLAEKGVDLERAEAMIRQALVADPGNGAYLDSLGWVLYRRGSFEGALDHLVQAVNVLPEDPVILEHLGMVLKASGRRQEALDMLRRALSFGGDRGRLDAVIAELEAAGTVQR